MSRIKTTPIPQGFFKLPRDTAILGIDPGLNACGVCMLESRGGLATFFTVRAPTNPDLGMRASDIAHTIGGQVVSGATALVIEHMQVYQQKDQVGDPNDLINLAFLEGAISQALTWNHIYLPTPKQWKGGIPKDVHHRRLRKKYPWVPPRISMDAMDAFGLALYGKERLECLSQ